MFNNLKDLLLKSLNKSGKREVIISSLIYNTIISEFLKLKNIDITTYIISVKIKENIILVNTQKPIINLELVNIKNILLKSINQKLENLGIKINNLDIKFK